MFTGPEIDPVRWVVDDVTLVTAQVMTFCFEYWEELELFAYTDTN